MKNTRSALAFSVPRAFFQACRRAGVTPTRYLFTVNIKDQTAGLFDCGLAIAGCELGRSNRATWEDFGSRLAIRRLLGQRRQLTAYRLIKTFVCSTSEFGIGEISGSNKTPRGLHRINEKIGGGCPAGTVFKSRKIVSYAWLGVPAKPITTRILWLDGLEPGFNRGGKVDTHARYIYIHGTGDEATIGRPASHGCVLLAARDLIPLYDKLPSGTLVWIAEY